MRTIKFAGSALSAGKLGLRKVNVPGTLKLIWMVSIRSVPFAKVFSKIRILCNVISTDIMSLKTKMLILTYFNKVTEMSAHV